MSHIGQYFWWSDGMCKQLKVSGHWEYDPQGRSQLSALTYFLDDGSIRRGMWLTDSEIDHGTEWDDMVLIGRVVGCFGRFLCPTEAVLKPLLAIALDIWNRFEIGFYYENSMQLLFQTGRSLKLDIDSGTLSYNGFIAELSNPDGFAALMNIIEESICHDSIRHVGQ